MNKLIAFLLIFFLTTTVNSQNLELINFASGFDDPVDIVNAGDDRLFIVEQAGKIKIIDGSGVTMLTPFLDIDDIVVDLQSYDERGLLGLAFHPNYETNGFFYVNYVDNNNTTRIARYSRDDIDPNRADPNSAVELMDIQQPASNHNGGCLKFGHDGYLYIGMGDGGSANDPWNNAQNTNVMLGKMLRIDVDNGSPYSIPADNPFVNNENVLDEIWAIGLRNPWRFSFDKMTGDLWISDVGQDDFEEIDFESAGSLGGLNYGWRCYEGTEFTGLNAQNECDGVFEDPAYEMEHMGSSGPCSITGGFVYRGAEFPDLIGTYLCADYCSGQVWAITPDGAGSWNGEEIDNGFSNVSTFGEDVNGELYIAKIDEGRIYKITTDICSTFEVSVTEINEPCEGENNGSASLNISGGTSPYVIFPGLDFENLAAGSYDLTITDNIGCIKNEAFEINALALPMMPTFSVTGNELMVSETFDSYQWLLNGSEIIGATSASFTALTSGSYTVVVTNNNGCSNTSIGVEVLLTNVKTIPGLVRFSVTPNPFVQDLSLELIVNKVTDFEIEILDNSGKRVYTKNLKVIDQLSQPIDLKELSKGVYFLNLKSKDGVVVRKIIKQ